MPLLIMAWINLILVLSAIAGTFAQIEGDVRLVEGSSTLEGRVEVYHEGEWGTICNQGWDDTDSLVVCKQLGFQVAVSSSPTFSPQAPTNQRIWLRNVECEEADERLLDCGITPEQWGQVTSCSHAADVGVQCSGLNVGSAPNYEGCYSFGTETLTKRTTSHSLNTIEYCIDSCSQDSLYAGVYGTECICGDMIDPSLQPVDSWRCSTLCPGNWDQLCGHDDLTMPLVSIFSVSIDEPYLASPWFPGSYVTENDVTLQPASIETKAEDVATDADNLVVRFLALDLADSDTLTVLVGDTETATFNSGDSLPDDWLVSGLPATTTVTATLMRATGSTGATGYLITLQGSLPTTNVVTTQAPTTLSTTTATPTTTQRTTSVASTSQDSVITTAKQTTGAETTTSRVTTAVRPEACTHPELDEGNTLTTPLPNNALYRVGDTVVLRCDEGLTPTEDTPLTCQADGTWDPTPSCISPGNTLATWAIVVIAVVCAIVLICAICMFMICAIELGKRDEKELEHVPAITHMETPADNDYTQRPVPRAMIPITEDSASRDIRRTTAVVNTQTVDPPPPPMTALSNDAVQQTEPIIITPAPTDPPSPTESYPPRDYPGSGNRDSALLGGIPGSHANGHANHLGREERQAVDELFNAVRDYDDSPATVGGGGAGVGGLYGSVPPRHLRSGSAISGLSGISIISNPGRVTDGPASPRYGGGYVNHRPGGYMR